MSNVTLLDGRIVNYPNLPFGREKGGTLKRQGGTITPFGFRSGDYVQSFRKGEIIRGWIGGWTNTEKQKNVSIFDQLWSKIGQFNPKNIKLLQRSLRICVDR